MKLFKRIDIEKENKLARESKTDFRRLVKVEILSRRIHTLAAMIMAAFILLDLTIAHKFDTIMLGLLITFLITSVLGVNSCQRRLRELHSIRGI